MEGFFTKKETESTTRPGGKVHSCHACGLYKSCKSPRMKPFGNFKKGIMNIGEAPGEAEDMTGKPWQGKVGKLLERTYKSLHVDLFDDCININAVLCRPTDANGHNRAPTNEEVDSCRRTVLQAIEKYKPKLIVLFGNAALYSLIGHRWMKDLSGITKWRGFTIPDQDYKAWLCPVFHPSFVERSESEEVMTVWKKDLINALAKLVDYKFPIYEEPQIEYLTDLSPLRRIKSGAIIAIDYETTGLKPHAVGHRIICASVADSPDHVYTFLIPKTKSEIQPFINLLRHPRIEKMAHNIKFEDTWSMVRLRQEVINWRWDSMQAAHILDNRPGITGLKFQAYVNFGIVDYSSDIAPYLQAVDNNNGNGINRIQELLKKPGGKDRLLKYCALDSALEYKLAMLQKSEILLPF